MQKGFFEEVYAIVAMIPKGKVMTYGQIAEMIGSPKAGRIVGYAMHSAPDTLPSHRVVNRRGEMAKGNIFGGEKAQRCMLEEEKITFLPNGCIDMEKHKWTIK